MKKIPSAPRLRALLGPSFILLGLGLGSGELILWPYLTSNWGMGIIWGAILGVTFQFFINMEIERYTLAKGESVFVGFARRYKSLPYWFITSTFFAWFWPGIIATSARLLGEVLGISNINLFGIGLLLLIGFIITLGPSVYKTVEKFSTILISISVPLIFLLAIYLAKRSDWFDLAVGIANFPKLPTGLPFASFLAAFAFAGAGGNLNLAQSFYIKEKGYGVGKFEEWWKVVNLEHLLIFWFGGIISILLLSLLAYSTVNGLLDLPTGVDFIIRESIVISQRLGFIIGTLFLIVGGLMLFNTQLTVFDATSRIMAENFFILKKQGNLTKIYYSFLWLQIAFGIIIFLFDFGQPLLLLTISAVLNAIAMFVHIGLTLNLNMRELEKEIRPNLFRIIMIIIAFLFFGYFSFRTIAGIF